MTANRKSSADISAKSCRLLLDAAPLAIWRLDADNRVLFANRRAADAIGLAPSDVIGRFATDLFAGPAGKWLAGNREVVETATPVVGVVEKTIAASGETRWLRIDKFPDAEENGKRRGLSVYLQDVTEFKTIETALRESEQHCANVIEFFPDPTMIIDRDGVLVAWNHAMEELTGVKARDIVGKGDHEYALPFYGERRPILIDLAMQPHDEVVAKYTFLERRGGAIAGEAYTPRLGKEKAHLYATATVLRDSKGEVVGAIESVRDNTARKLAEDQARDTNEKLAALVQVLEEQSRYNDIMSEMREFLQACSTMAETAPIILASMKKLFPATDGAMFLLSPSRTELETVAKWGDFPEDIDDNLFPPENCWGLRRGRPYAIGDVANGLLCRHVKHPPSHWYACLPLMAKGDVLGLLHLRGRAADAAAEGRQAMTGVVKSATSLTEILSLSIANIKLRETLSNQSIRDPLTALFNRRFMEETLHREILRAMRKPAQIGVVMLDIDHFKKFNDIYGHAAGDQVLTQLAKYFRGRLRESDFVCRYGGEEFTIILPECPAAEAVMRANRVREEVKLLKVYHLGQELGAISLSMGVAAYPDYGTTVDDLLRVADVALYRAKEEGRDRVVLGQLPDLSTRRTE